MAVPPTIEVHPASLTIPPGTQQQFSATEVYPDGREVDVTGTVTWTSSAPAVAGIGDGASTKGIVTAVAAGSTTITATAADGIAGSAALKVMALKSIEIAIDPPTMPVGISKQLTATGVFSDNTTQDITTLVSWSSSNAAVATVSNAADRKGYVTSLSPGPTTISATLAGVTGSAGLSVTTATLATLAIDQTDATIALGTIKKLSVTGTYSDRTTHNLSASATWTSTAPSVATVNTALDSNGRISVVAVASGTTTIKAEFGGLMAQVNVTVTTAQLRAIALSPRTPVVGKDIEPVQFTAIGTFSDGTEQDLTDSVQWGTSNEAIAVVSNNMANVGLATTVGVGEATISASMVSSSAPPATAVMKVTPSQPTLISMSPTSGPINQQVHVYGTNFMKGLTSVLVGGTEVPADLIMVASSSFLTFTVPEGTATSSSVAVKTLYGTTNAAVFTVGNPVDPPAVTTISPTLGPAGQTVTVHGSNFEAGHTTVTFVGSPPIAATVLDTETLIFTVPTVPSGTVSAVTVTTTIGTSNSSSQTFTVGTPTGAPTVTSIDYSFGPRGAYRIVYGTNFVFGATTVNVGGVTGIPATVYNPTTLSFLVPQEAVGNTKVTVVTPKGSADSPTVFVVTKR